MIGNFLTDAWNALTGKPQSWYTNVSNIQNQISVLMAGISAVGSDLWNTVSSAGGFEDYDTTMGILQSSIKSIIVTESHVPSDDDIASAKGAADHFQQNLDVVSSYMPEVQPIIQQDQANVQSMLPAPMNAPAAAGQQAFADELSKRAAALGQGFMDFASLLPWILGGAAALWIASQRGGRRAA